LFAVALLSLSVAAAPPLPGSFDSLGPTVQRLTLPDGRVVNFIDDGSETGLPVVFVGGLGTSVRVIRLLDFLRSMRQELGIRVISVERNGFGETAFNPALDMADYASDVEAALARLGVGKFALFGISGGGPYVMKIASRNGARLLSVHLAATSPTLGRSPSCEKENPAGIFRDLLKNPQEYFAFNESSPIHRVSGLQDTAYEEAARAAFVRGQLAAPAALDHEAALYCREGAIDTTSVTADTYAYMGLADPLIANLAPEDWQAAFPNASVKVRAYPGEGHDVQYRHLDQILLDLAGYGDKTLVCDKGQARLADLGEVKQVMKEGGFLGLCAWGR
ncbi:MAG: alpha/beta fold hydrolase, partial [Pseudomonadales bacterium]